MQIQGTLKVIFDTVIVSDKFKKREYVLTTDASTPYPQHCLFQLTQNKCDDLNNLKVGDEILVDFNLRGREWSGPQGIKYFNTLETWKITLVSSTQQPVQDTPKSFNEQIVEKQNNTITPPVDGDLPF